MLYHKMSLNPEIYAGDASSPSAKLSFNINAFNGNTTNFNRACPSSKTIPVQPRQEIPSFSPNPKPNAGRIMPM